MFYPKCKQETLIRTKVLYIFIIKVPDT
ncbi:MULTISPECIES: cysteine-rich KTR domain-containing protein [Lachnospiraceae]|nr:cysteine-rich KTR domain-containing protein [[Clostridium] symbiosum]